MGSESEKEIFARIFGNAAGKLHVIRAPGRVNLIGEHTDYNDGYVFPMAIEPEIRIVCRLRQDSLVRIASTTYPGAIVEFSLDNKIERGEPAWANYSKGVAAQLRAGGITVMGMDALISNSLPVSGGLSSSAAIEVATALAFLKLSGQSIDPSRLAMMCQKAEHEYALAPCGIMDQTIVISAMAGHAMLLDCRDLKKQFVPLDPKDLRVVIVNSMVKHSIGGGEYGQRRKQCEAGVAFFKRENPSVQSLRDVTLPQVESAKGKLDDVVFRRCRHVVTESARTVEAAAMLSQHRYESVGKLMLQSHASLRDDYEVSIPELDFLVDQAMTIKGVYGARMTGGGFGGCIVALTQPRASDTLVSHLTKSYAAKYPHTPSAFVTTATDGASVLE